MKMQRSRADPTETAMGLLSYLGTIQTAINYLLVYTTKSTGWVCGEYINLLHWDIQDKLPSLLLYSAVMSVKQELWQILLNKSGYDKHICRRKDNVSHAKGCRHQ